MVKSATIGLSLLLITAVGATPSASSDGVLEQMQREVAAIVRSARSAVVSIEDERALVSKVLEDPATRREIEKAIRDARKAIAEALREHPEQKAQLRALDRALREKPQNRERIDALRKALKEQAKGRNPAQERALQDRLAIMPEIEATITRSIPPGAQARTFLVDAPKSGTGFSVGENYIVTTADVLEGMKSPVIITDAGTRIKAKVVGVDSDLNVGLLQLAAQADVPALKLGDSAQVEVGHFAISIGNQSGQNNSVALTLVAGLRTEGTLAGRRFYPGLIQIAGTVGAGTSGAPLVNARGEVIGMIAGVPAGDWTEFRIPQPPQAPRQGRFNPEPARATFRAALPVVQTETPPAETAEPEGEPSEQKSQGKKPSIQTEDQGLIADIPFLRPPVTSAGFAIPINNIKPVLEEMRSGGKVTRGWMGIILQDETYPEEHEGFVKLIRTVKITGVHPDSPAFYGGVQPGDILIRLNDKPVENASEVRAASIRLRPGDTLPMVIKRGGDTLTIRLKILARPKVIRTKPITEPIKHSSSE